MKELHCINIIIYECGGLLGLVGFFF